MRRENQIGGEEEEEEEQGRVQPSLPLGGPQL